MQCTMCHQLRQGGHALEEAAVVGQARLHHRHVEVPLHFDLLATEGEIVGRMRCSSACTTSAMPDI
eukprot:9704907-Prorocentrum_lima.AAC.1